MMVTTVYFLRGHSGDKADKHSVLGPLVRMWSLMNKYKRTD